MRNNFVILVFMFLFYFSGCGGSGDAVPDNFFSSTSDAGVITGTLFVPDAATQALATSNPILARTAGGVRVYLDDDESKYDDTDDDGQFRIEGVPVGAKCIHAVFQLLGNETYGFRACDIEVGEEEVDIGENEMSLTGSITGTVTLSDSTGYEGITIYVPGTSFSARTDANGNFTMSDLPAGDYEVKIERDGYVSRWISNVTVASGESVFVGTLSLIEEESCTDNGAVLAIASIEQDVQSVAAGETATFTLEACSSLDLEIDYEWYLGSCPPGGEGEDGRISVGNEFSYQVTDDDSGVLVFCGKAYIDNNNVETVLFYLNIETESEDRQQEADIAGDASQTEDDAAASDGGSSESDEEEQIVTAPVAIGYVVTDSTYVVGVPVNSYTPSITGGGSLTFSVSPELPAGINLDPDTGEFYGTPTEVSSDAHYTVTASNSLGSVSTTVAIEVVSHMFRVYVQDEIMGEKVELRIYDRDNGDDEFKTITLKEGSYKEFAIDHSTNKAYFTGYGSIAGVGVLDLFSNQIVDAFNFRSIHAVIDEDEGIGYFRTFSPGSTGYLYKISRVNLATGTTLAAGEFPWGNDIAVDRVRGYVYVNGVGGKIGVFAADTLQKLAEFTLPASTLDVAVDELTGKYYVLSMVSWGISQTVSVFSAAGTVASASIPVGVGSDETSLLVVEESNRLFVVNDKDVTLSVIDTSNDTLIQTQGLMVLTPTYVPKATMILDEQANQVYICIGDTLNVYDIDTAQIVEVLDYGTTRPSRINLLELGQ